MTEPQPSTPPHFPTYMVKLSHEKIQDILSLVLPEHELIASKQLEHGKSFNNRIYFLETSVKQSNPSATFAQIRKRFVLKLSGHYFGASKVQNEVGSLLLLQKYCSSVPTPEVLAWSECGDIVQTADGRTFDISNSTDASSKHGWILTTCLPGRALTAADLNGPYGPSLIKEVARHVGCWWKSIPNPGVIGNIRFAEGLHPALTDRKAGLLCDDESDEISSLAVGGLILCYQQDSPSLLTALSYYTYLASDQLAHLRHTPALQPLYESVGKDVRAFIDSLSQLKFFQEGHQNSKAIKFTHLDIGPRNILISEQSRCSDGQNVVEPHVTGMVDFEFAAFLPYEDEVINMTVRQADDWSTEQYQILATELAVMGFDVPHSPGQFGEPICIKRSTGECSCDTGAYEGLSIISRIIENIKPWYIQEGSHSGKELQRQIDTAAATILSGVHQLKRFLT